MGTGPLRRHGPDLLLEVRLTPRAARDGIDGPVALADGRTVIAARVRAVAEDGRANAALTDLVAAVAGVPKSAVAVAAGRTARLKTLRIASVPEADEAPLRQRLGI